MAELIKFYDKTDLSINMRVTYESYVKHRFVIRFKFGDKFLTSLTKLVLAAKASICSTIKENLLLYCRKILAFVVVVIIQHMFNTALVSKRNTSCNRNH